jgi:hypothetical protein
MLESSRAVKCPSLRYHLAGMKCFQLALTKDSFLRTIFSGENDKFINLKEVLGEMFTVEQVESKRKRSYSFNIHSIPFLGDEGHEDSPSNRRST